MKHRIGFNKLSKNVSHRQALYRSMATALFKYERIKTTKPKAREIRRVAEKMITRARTDSVHNRRIIGKRIRDKAVLAKLFTDIAPRFKSRPGGYTRILKLGQRYGDASEMVLLELVERIEAEPKKRRKEPAAAESEPAREAGEAQTGPESKGARESAGPKASKSKAAKSRSDTGKKGSAAKPGTKATKVAADRGDEASGKRAGSTAKTGQGTARAPKAASKGNEPAQVSARKDDEAKKNVEAETREPEAEGGEEA